jgi:hypothetical protein
MIGVQRPFASGSASHDRDQRINITTANKVMISPILNMLTKGSVSREQAPSGAGREIALGCFT